jgi:hypothetical protein
MLWRKKENIKKIFEFFFVIVFLPLTIENSSILMKIVLNRKKYEKTRKKNQKKKVEYLSHSFW